MKEILTDPIAAHWQFWFLVLVAGIVLHYGYGKVQGWREKKADVVDGRRYMPTPDTVPFEFLRPMSCQPSNPEWGRVDPTLPAPTGNDLRGFILESRRFEPGTDQEIIERLTSKETANE